MATTSSPETTPPPTAVVWPDRINQAYYGELGEEAGRKARDRINWMCGQAQGDSVLDIGCSQGITSLLLAREGFAVLGVDISAEAIDYASREREKEVASVAARLEFLCTDLAGLAPQRLFDTVIMGEVLEHQTHTARFLNAAARHVKPGGSLVVTVPFGLHPFPDHKATIFPRGMLAALDGAFSTSLLDIQEGYIRFVGVKDGGKGAADAADLARVTEVGAYEAQEKYFTLRAKHALASKKAAELKSGNDELSKALATASAQRDALDRNKRNLQEQIQALDVKLAAAMDSDAAMRREHGAQQVRVQSDIAEMGAQLRASRDAHAALERDQAAQLDQLKAAQAARAALERDLTAQLAQRKGDQAALVALERTHAEQQQRQRAELAAVESTLKASMDAQTALQRGQAAQRAKLDAELAATASQLQETKKKYAAMAQDKAAQATRLQAQLEALNQRLASKQAQAQAAALSHKAQIASLNARLARDAEMMPRKIAALEMSAMAVKKTLSFQLGNVLISGFKSPRAMLGLPRALWALRAQAQARRLARAGGRPERSKRPAKAQAKGELSSEEFEALLQHFSQGGIAAVSAFLAARQTKPVAAAAAFTALARHLLSVLPLKAADAAREAYLCDPQPYRGKWLAFRLFDAGYVVEPAELLAKIGATAELSMSEQRRAEEIAALFRLRQQFPPLPLASRAAYAAQADSMLYVAASALPYHTSGYTIRTQELVRSLLKSGLKVSVLTKPGYPWDRADRRGEPQGQRSVVEQIEYLHLPQPSHALPLDAYFDDAARAIAAVATRRKVALIHAASNHVNALPALMAARSLGIPFVYEMRGLWELSRASKTPDYDSTERFQIGIDLEAYVARHADKVYVISAALGRHIEAWGVAPERIALLPNCVNLETMRKAVAKAPAAKPAVFTVGYAGALVGYEGLDLLIEAIAQLKADAITVDACIIGDGDVRAQLEARCAELGLTKQIRFLGKLAPDQARAQLSALHAVALPRKAHQVCELIPPIKLIEAMALGLPVIVPDLPVFREEVVDGQTGVLFKAGDAAALAQALAALAGAPEQAAALGQRARERAGSARVWGGFARDVRATVDALAAPIDTAPAAPVSSVEEGAEALAALYRRAGQQGVVDLVTARLAHATKRVAPELLRIGKLLSEQGLEEAEHLLAQAALAGDRSEPILRGAFWAAQRAKAFTQSCDIIIELERMYGKTPSDQQQEFLRKLKAAPAYQLSILKEVRKPSAPQIDSIPNRLCYVLHNTLPYSSGGYATRSHGVATGIAQAGWDVVVLSRPGFPLDIKPELQAADVNPVDTVDGIPYVRTLAPLRAGMSAREYMLAAADAIEARLREYRPAVVIGASNHVTALPALIAASRLGLPFVYEVRGLWEITRLSRDSGFADTATFAVQKTLEASVAQLADHVFTLTEPMREELVLRGVPQQRIDLLPNSCDPTRFQPVARNAALAASLGIPDGVPVIGYIGTFVDYEGLEDLAAACGLLKQRGVSFRLLMVGNENASAQGRGPITEQIIEVAAQYGFSDWLILAGRVPHEEVEAYYSLVDVAPFPRKPLPVCEMVSPMKPLEALAMEKAVVVSSVRALVEMIADGKTGLVFEKGSVESLATTLDRLIQSPALRAQLGVAGRQWVERERTWKQIGERAGAILVPFVSAAGSKVA